MGKDCFVLKIASGLESHVVVLFCINVILHGSHWFPVVYISSCIKSFETLLFLTGAVTGTFKKHWMLGIITTVYPGTWRVLPSFQVQVWHFVPVPTACWDEAQMLSVILLSAMCTLASVTEGSWALQTEWSSLWLHVPSCLGIAEVIYRLYWGRGIPRKSIENNLVSEKSMWYLVWQLSSSCLEDWRVILVKGIYLSLCRGWTRTPFHPSKDFLLIKTKETGKAKEHGVVRKAVLESLQFLSLCQTKGQFIWKLTWSLHILLNCRGQKLHVLKTPSTELKQIFCWCWCPREHQVYEVFPDNFALDAKYCPAVSNDTHRAVSYTSITSVYFFRKQVQMCQGNSA